MSDCFDVEIDSKFGFNDGGNVVNDVLNFLQCWDEGRLW